MLNPHPVHIRANSSPVQQRSSSSSTATTTSTTSTAKHDQSTTLTRVLELDPKNELIEEDFTGPSSQYAQFPEPPPSPVKQPTKLLTRSKRSSTAAPPAPNASRPSSSSGLRDAKPWDSFTDLKLLQRRRSTGTKKPTHSGKPPMLSTQSRATPSTTIVPQPTPTFPRNKPAKLEFSTTDRKILEELKRTLHARESQFILKGIDAKGAGKKHHPYSTRDVPYPRSYEREVVDLDVWETSFFKQLCGSLTRHVFENPPARVLDIGCGTGTWILDCARIWKNCHFVGLDIVPLHPDLTQMGSSDLASRITWVQDNFLERLPFPNEEFDFVHIKRIARGVPEDKWDTLLEEITRVMKPGAAFEMIEDDLDFPGKELESEPETEPALRTNTSKRRSQSFSFSDIGSDYSSGFTSPSRPSSGSPIALSPMVTAFPPTPPRSTPPTPPIFVAEEIQVQMPTITEQAESQRTTPREASTPHPRLDSEIIDAQIAPRPSAPEPPSPLESPAPYDVHMQSLPPMFLTRNEAEEKARRMNVRVSPSKNAPLLPPVLPHSPMSSMSPVERKLLPLLPSVSASSLVIPTRPRLKRSRSHSYSKTFIQPTPPSPHLPHTSLSRLPPISTTSSPPASSPVDARAPLFLLRTLPKPPRNPRDHSLLEIIYKEMHASRFINLSPLKLLASSLSTYFQDVRTHPPLQFKFPPLLPKRTSRRHRSSKSSKSFVDSSNPDSDDSSAPSDHSHQCLKSNPHGNGGSSRNLESGPQYLTAEELLLGASPYASLDITQLSAFSPSTRNLFPTVGMMATFPPGTNLSTLQELLTKAAGAQGPKTPGGSPSTFSALQIRLPNPTVNFDLRSLHLHLATRAAEVCACAEAMWGWVVDYQTTGRGGAVPGSLTSEILELRRSDFDGLIARFDMDMRDHMGLDSILGNQLSWSNSPSRTQERKEFDAECEKWARYQREKAQSPHSSVHPYRYGEQFNDHAESSLSIATNATFATLPLAPDLGEARGMNYSERRNSIGSPGRARRQHRRSKTESSASVRDMLSTEDLRPSPTHRICRTLRVFIAWKA